jgi:glycosyltransferase involved in cell wall biosynthesis
VLPGNWPREQQLRLIASADAVVSLHRAEGLGLTLAEALLLEKPVIATAFGGNTDFTTPETAFLVDYVSVPIGESVGPYPATACWAEPSLSTATELMRAVASNRGLAKERAARGRRLLHEVHGVEVVAALMRERLLELAQPGSQSRRRKNFS